MAKKVIVVGIDGASPNLLNEMFEQGLLPHLREIRQRGVSGTLLSTHHPITPAAWTSIITGLGPGMHGLFDFRRRVCGSFDVKVLKGKDRDGETIWHLLVEAGYSVGVWNVPMTFPPERVRGFWVSGMDTPDQKLCFTYPSSLTTWLDRRTGGYLIDVGQGASTEEEYVEEILHLQRIHRQAFESLLQRYQPDACLGVFTTTDRIQHAFWKYLDPEQEAYHSPRAAVFRESVRKCYEDIDDFLGFLLEEYVGKQGAVLIVVSDHGFGPLYKDVYLNQWLADQGYLKLRDRGGAWEGVSLFERIDWERTIAYSFGYFGSLYLNLQGREPLGVVKPGREQRQILTRLKKELEQLQLPEGDGPLVDGLYELQELYSGPYVELGPDLLVVMQNYALMSRDTFDVPRGVLFSEPMAYQHIAIKHSGNHRMEGIIFMIGEGIAEGQYLPNASVLDVAPTVLYLMGLPIPVYMEGRVLTEALEPGSPEVQYVERRMVSKAPTLHRLASQVYLLQAIRERQSHLIAEQRRQLKWWRSLWPVRLMRWVKRVLRIK
jgi:predicted AlkP superfamily phosphohydrolase/phosphomutase